MGEGRPVKRCAAIEALGNPERARSVLRLGLRADMSLCSVGSSPMR